MVVSNNFTVIVFAAGEGNRLRSLTKTRPKALLPVASKPLISYTLNALEAKGFLDIIVIIQEDAQQLDSYLQTFETRANISVVCVEKDTTTIGSLKEVADRVPGDFIIISSDLIFDFNISEILDMHRLNDASLTVTFSNLCKADKDIKFEKKDKALFEVVGYCEKTNRLLALTNAADLENDFQLSRTVLKKYPRLSYTTDWQDCHFYICKRWILDYIKEEKYMESVKLELIPLLVRKQFKKTKANPDDKTTVYSKIPIQNNCELDEDPLRCFYYFADGFVRRTNTVTRYFDVNLNLRESSLFKESERVSASSEISQQTQIKNDSMIGESCKIGDRCSIKTAIIGSHCQIANNVKIMNSVLMDHVVIEAGCVIQNTIVCNDVFIGSSSKIQNCIVEASCSVEENTQYRDQAIANKTFADDDGFTFY